MPPRARALGAAAIAAAVLVAALAGCGTGGGGTSTSATPGAPTSVAFPKPRGRTLGQLRRSLGPGPALAPSVSVLAPGRDRFGFALFDRGRRQIADAPAAIYVAARDGTNVRGPFPAQYQSLEVKPRFRSRTSGSDPDAARSVYTARPAFPVPGTYAVMGVARLDERPVAAAPIAVEVGTRSPVPGVGRKAPEITTPTVKGVEGAVNQIETRVPPDSMHEVDYSDAYGVRPILLLFATPALCQSRVCGPAVDIAEEVKSRREGPTAFIHMEIYNHNRVEDGFRPQVTKFGLPTEPWAFAIDRRGRVAARLEGAFGARELEQAVAAAERG